jgi:hypothetical protein
MIWVEKVTAAIGAKNWSLPDEVQIAFFLTFF